MCQRRLRGEPRNQGLLLLLLAGFLLLLFSSPFPLSSSRFLPGCDARLLPLDQLESWGYGGTGENFHGNGDETEETSSSRQILARLTIPAKRRSPPPPPPPAPVRVRAPAPVPVPAPAHQSPVPAPAHHSPAPAPAPAPHARHSPEPAPPGKPVNSTSPTSAPIPGKSSKDSLLWAFLIGPAVFVIFVATVFIVRVRFMMKRRRRRALGTSWKQGLSFKENQQLQKYDFAGVPPISFEELEAACEEFTNVIGTSADCIIFKGIRISDGLQIAVTRMNIPPERWTAKREIGFRHKVEDLARRTHDNLVNLLAYCATDTPFERMLVFEYASNGTLYEHLHARGTGEDNLEWPTRMRIVMGAACGLEYLHHKLVPPTSHFKFDAGHVFLTEDYAAKLADFAIAPDSMDIMSLGSLGRRKSFKQIVNSIGYNDWEMSLSRQAPNLESNIRSFGMFLLEVITGRSLFTDTQGPLDEWAKDYLNTPEKMEFLVDPSLKTFNKSELVALCEVIRTCIRPKANKVPTMNEVADQLSTALKMTREAANRKISPLLWAEMELLASMDHSASIERSADEFPLSKSPTSPMHKKLGSCDSGKLSPFSPGRDPNAITKSLSRNGSGDNERRGMTAISSSLPKVSLNILSLGGPTTHSSNRLWAANASELETLSPNNHDSGSGEDQVPLAASINSSLPRDRDSLGRSFRRVWVENSTEMSRLDHVSPRGVRSPRSDNLDR